MARKLKPKKKSQPKSFTKRVMIIHLKKRPLKKAAAIIVNAKSGDNDHMDGNARNAKVCCYFIQTH